MAQQSFMPDEAEIPPRKGPRCRKRKYFDLWYRTPTGYFTSWCRFGKYATEETAKRVIAQKANSLYFGRCEWHIGSKPE